jgi:predicted alpha/beta hydrolase
VVLNDGGAVAAIILHRNVQRCAWTFGAVGQGLSQPYGTVIWANGMTDIFKRRTAYIASSGGFDVCIMTVTNVGAARPTGDH